MLEERVKDVRETELQTSPSRPIKSLHSPVGEGTLSRDEMELRRMEAAEDFLHGLSNSGVVAKFGVSRTTAWRWHRALTAKGLESLRKGKPTGRPSRLTPEQKAQIADMFQKGDFSFGFSDDHWTAKFLARVIEERFSVHYSLDHVARLLAKLGTAAELKSMRARASEGED
jgi:transposase